MGPASGLLEERRTLALENGIVSSHSTIDRRFEEGSHNRFATMVSTVSARWDEPRSPPTPATADEAHRYEQLG